MVKVIDDTKKFKSFLQNLSKMRKEIEKDIIINRSK